MKTIDQQADLLEFCAEASTAPYITVDTEFLRENTFYAKLCLVQVAFPGEGNAAVIDVMADGVDLAPLIDLFKNPKIIKVFHAARQDLEIFYYDYDVLPAPFFDTQIAAMAAGYGDQVGYETLVKSLTKGKIDKTSRFTDWSRRPLSKAQLEYALKDVTYLREIYEILNEQLTTSGRIKWVQEEFSALLEPALYDPPIDEIWKRIRARTNTPKFLAYIRELATFRETYAREKNIPRSRVFKDDALLEAASQRPKNLDDLKRLRLWKDKQKGPVAEGALEAVGRAEALDPKDYPKIEKRGHDQSAADSVVDLLRVYLKAQAEKNQVATRLICTSSDLEDFALDPDGASPLNKGWRKEVFGKGARAIVRGEAALIANGKYVDLVNINGN